MIGQQGELLISAGRLRHNVELFRQRLADHQQDGRAPAICATLKANAYGHGLEQVLPVLSEAGVRWACVYSLAEATEAARLAPDMNLLVLAPIVLRAGMTLDEELLKAVAGGRVRLTLTDVPSAQHLAEMLDAALATRPLRVHVQVDTGLTRAGATAAHAAELVELIEMLRPLELEGIFSHLSHGDAPGHETVRAQCAGLWQVARPVKQRRPDIMVHLQNSGGAWHGAAADDELDGLDMVRVGIGLYGLQPSLAHPIADLQPVARLMAAVLAIHERPAGVGVGYGHTFVTQRASHLAIVPVGYADGYPRAMSNRGVVQIGGATAAVVGRVSMDQIVVDVTDLVGVEVGTMVTVLSDEPGDPNCVDRIAEACGTIGYEIATHFGGRLRRSIVD